MDEMRGIAEETLGDCADDPRTPTAIGALEIGRTTIEATQRGDPRDVDFVTFTVPEGAELAGLTLDGDEAGSGNLAFLGIARGHTTAIDPDAPDATALLGGITYGAGQPGRDIPDRIGALPGAEDFDGPLGAGAYTLWLNQTGPASTVALGLETREAADEADRTFAPAALADGAAIDGGGDTNTTGVGADLATGDTVDLRILARQRDLEGGAAIDALADFAADNVVFEEEAAQALAGTDGDDRFRLGDAAMRRSARRRLRPMRGTTGARRRRGGAGSSRPRSRSAICSPETSLPLPDARCGPAPPARAQERREARRRRSFRRSGAECEEVLKASTAGRGGGR